MSDKTKGDQIESVESALAEGHSIVEVWLKRIKDAKDEESDWHEAAEEAIEIFEADGDNPAAFNVLHSNTSTMLPALYNSTPVPDVRRRFAEGDMIAKHVVDVSERLLAFSVDQYDFDDEMKAAARDGYVAGRGTCRIRYEPKFAQAQTMGPDGKPFDYEIKTYEEVRFERVPWCRWGRGPGFAWRDVPFIWFCIDMTRDDLLKLTGDEARTAELIRLNAAEGDEDENTGKGAMKTLEVYEIWDRDTRQVWFITEAEKSKPLKVIPDPLKLQGFFPIVRPFQPLKRVSGLTPLCPYTVWKPLFVALDKVTRRIDRIIAQLKVRGLYDSKLDKDLELLRSAEDGQYIAANDATMFSSGPGGLEKAIAHWPMEPSVKALQQLEIMRAQIKAFIDEVTGVADVLRGNVDPNKKLGQTQMEAQWGSLRLQDMQNEIARMARDMFRMKIEVMANLFSPETIRQQTLFPSTPEQEQVFGQVMQVFKSDVRQYRIDIETDSTVRADVSRSQQQMNMFLAGTAQFVQGMTQAGAMMPPLLMPMAEVYAAFARQFKLGKQAEDAIDKFITQLPAFMQQAMAPKEDPNQAKAEADAKRAEAEGQRDEQRHRMKMRELGAGVQVAERRAQIETQKMADQAAIRQQEQAAGMMNGGVIQ